MMPAEDETGLMVDFTLIHVDVIQSSRRGSWQVVLVMCTTSVMFASLPQLDVEQVHGGVATSQPRVGLHGRGMGCEMGADSARHEPPRLVIDRN